MQVPRKALNGRHLGTAQFAIGAERKRRRMAKTETRDNLERAFNAYGKPREAVSEFRYLGRILTATDNNRTAVTGNIKKARGIWGCLAQLLGREGADPKVSRNFYTAATQQVLLFRAETWVLTRNMESALDAYQGRVERNITGSQPRCGRDRRWFYPSLAGAMKEAGIVRIRTLILRRQNTVAQFIATRPSLGLCKGAVRRPGAWVPRRRRDQTGIDWKGAREKAAATKEETSEAAEPEVTGLDLDSEADTLEETACGNREEASLGASGSSGAEWSGAED